MMESRLREAFTNVAVPGPRPGFEARVVAETRARRQRRRQRFVMSAYWVAATLVAALALADAAAAPPAALKTAVLSMALVLGSGAVAAGGLRGLARLLIHTVH